MLTARAVFPLGSGPLTSYERFFVVLLLVLTEFVVFRVKVAFFIELIALTTLFVKFWLCFLCKSG